MTDLAREAAYEAVASVHRDDAYANLVLPAILDKARLPGRDAALVTELVYGTLRRRGTLDAVIGAAAERTVDRIDPQARDALRIGAYQLLFTRVPAHAAVSTTVGIVKTVAPGAAGFTNAVLRNVSTASLDEWLSRVAPAYDDDPVTNLAVTHSHPPWIVRAFAEALGNDLAEVALALAEDNEPPAVHLCARPGRADPGELADDVGGAPGAFSPYAVYLPGGDPGGVPAVASGAAHVQDEGSQLVTLALAEVPVAPPGSPRAAEMPGVPAGPVASPEIPVEGGRSPGSVEEVPEGLAGAPVETGGAPVADSGSPRWLDLCAGPGGKAALLGALAGQRGAHLTAVEVTEHRARMVERAVRGMPVTVLCEDGRAVGSSPDLPEAAFDRVLLDAPCTGLGSLRRRPEARWRRQPRDLPALTRLQRELLVAAIAAVRAGGVVGYVTCSPHVVETQVTVAEGRRRSPHPTELIDARPYLPEGMPGLGDGPMVQLWPHRHGTDAMFLALLRRTG